MYAHLPVFSFVQLNCLIIVDPYYIEKETVSFPSFKTSCIIGIQNLLPLGPIKRRVRPRVVMILGDQTDVSQRSLIRRTLDQLSVLDIIYVRALTKIAKLFGAVLPHFDVR